jgi:hypothetical protein
MGKDKELMRGVKDIHWAEEQEGAWAEEEGDLLAGREGNLAGWKRAESGPYYSSNIGRFQGAVQAVPAGPYRAEPEALYMPNYQGCTTAK